MKFVAFNFLKEPPQSGRECRPELTVRLPHDAKDRPDPLAKRQRRSPLAFSLPNLFSLLWFAVKGNGEDLARRWTFGLSKHSQIGKFSFTSSIPTKLL